MNFIKALCFLPSLLIFQCFSVSALNTSTIPNTILDCGSANKLQLGTTKQMITFRSYEYSKNCDWTIPKTVQNNEYGLVLVLKNVTLPNPPEGCAGSLRFPKTHGYACQFTPSYCLVYATNPTLCNFQKVTRTFQNYNTSACESFTTWFNTDTPKIQYNAAHESNVYKEFVLYYLPVYCIEPTTTTTTSTTSTTTTTTTTLSPTTSKAGIATSSTSSKSNSSTNSKSPLPPSNTEGQEAPAAGMDVSTIGLIVGAAALILLLGIGIILHKKKQNVLEFPIVSNRNFKKTEEIDDFYEEYSPDPPENNQTNETQFDEQENQQCQPDQYNERKTKPEYENTSYQTSEMQSEIYSAVVKKR